MVNRQKMTIFWWAWGHGIWKEVGHQDNLKCFWTKNMGRQRMAWLRMGARLEMQMRRWGDYQKSIYNIFHLRHQLAKWRCSIQHWNMEFRSEVQVGCKLQHFHPEGYRWKPWDWMRSSKKEGVGKREEVWSLSLGVSLTIFNSEKFSFPLLPLLPSLPCLLCLLPSSKTPHYFNLLGGKVVTLTSHKTSEEKESITDWDNNLLLNRYCCSLTLKVI